MLCEATRGSSAGRRQGRIKAGASAVVAVATSPARVPAQLRRGPERSGFADLVMIVQTRIDRIDSRSRRHYHDCRIPCPRHRDALLLIAELTLTCSDATVTDEKAARQINPQQSCLRLEPELGKAEK